MIVNFFFKLNVQISELPKPWIKILKYSRSSNRRSTMMTVANNYIINNIVIIILETRVPMRRA